MARWNRQPGAARAIAAASAAAERSRPLEEPAAAQAAGPSRGERTSLMAQQYWNWASAVLRSVLPLVFVSYAREDRKDVQKLRTLLQTLVNAGVIQLWSDHQLEAGADWKSEIEARIHKAHILILVLTGPYLASETIMTWELPRIMERATAPETAIFPILARQCAFQSFPWLEGAQIWPDGKQPLFSASERQIENRLTDLAVDIKKVADRFMRTGDDPTEVNT
jgi:hypothetical protein